MGTLCKKVLMWLKNEFEGVMIKDRDLSVRYTKLRRLRLFDVLKKSINLPVKACVPTPTCIRVVNPC